MKEPEFNDLDQLFFDHFKDHSVTVSNSQNLWSRIEKQIRKKNRGLFIFFGMLILISLATFLPNISQSKSSITNFRLSNSSPENLNRANHIDQFLNSPDNDPSVSIKHEDHLSAIEMKPFNIHVTTQVPQTTLNLHLRNSNKKDHSKAVIMKVRNSSDFTRLPTLSNYQKSGINALSHKPDPLMSKTPKKVLPCESKSIKGRFFVDVYSQGSISLDRVALKPGMASDPNGYRDQWASRYQTLSSVMGGFMMGYSFPWQASISAGIEYQHIESQYQVLQTVTERITVFDPMAYFYYDTNNEVVWVGDSVTAINIYDRRVSFGNHHRLINIPFVFSYHLVDKGAFRLSAQVETYLNISHTYRGRFLREDQSLIQINAPTDTGYMANKIGVGIGAGIHLGYWLGNHWELYAQPNFRYNRSGYLDSSQGLLVSRHFIGLRAGIQYHF